MMKSAAHRAACLKSARRMSEVPENVLNVLMRRQLLAAKRYMSIYWGKWLLS